MENVPDMNSIFDSHESENERWNRHNKRLEHENELEFVTVPDDYGKHEDCYPRKEK